MGDQDGFGSSPNSPACCASHARPRRVRGVCGARGRSEPRRLRCLPRPTFPLRAFWGAVRRATGGCQSSPRSGPGDGDRLDQQDGGKHYAEECGVGDEEARRDPRPRAMHRSGDRDQEPQLGEYETEGGPGFPRTRTRAGLCGTRSAAAAVIASPAKVQPKTHRTRLASASRGWVPPSAAGAAADAQQ
jgi:hypothetical protein